MYLLIYLFRECTESGNYPFFKVQNLHHLKGEKPAKLASILVKCHENERSSGSHETDPFILSQEGQQWPTDG